MHKRIGILGGLSPESTVAYYEYITRTYTQRYGDYGYPEVLIYSVNFQRYVDWQSTGRWDEAREDMIRCFGALRRAGADFGLIATNTMHIVFDEVARAVKLPLVSIIDAAADAVLERGLERVGLLGTKFTMREAFYRDGLARRGLNVLVPSGPDQERINAVIYGELCRGRITGPSHDLFCSIAGNLLRSGAEGIILGCTEIPMLLKPEDVEAPLFNTTLVHAEMALRRAVRRV